MNIGILEELEHLGQFARIDLIKKQRDVFQSQDVDFLIRKAGMLADQGSWETVVELMDLALIIAVALEDDLTLAKVLTVQARALFESGGKQIGIHCSLQALNMLKRCHKTTNEIADFFREHELGFGVALLENQTVYSLEPKSAIQVLENVIQVFSQHDYELGLGFAYLYKGDAFKQVLRYEDAWVSYLRALPILRKYGMPIAELLLNLDFVCLNLDQLSEAAKYLDEAEAIFELEKNALGLAAIYINKASQYRRKGPLRKVVRLYRQARELFEKNQQIHDVAFTNMNVGTLLLQYPGHANQSQEFLAKALAVFEKEADRPNIAKVRTYLAGLYYSQKEFEKAQELLELVVSESSEMIASDTLWQSYYHLGSLSLEKNPGVAYEYFQDGVQIIDNLRSSLRTEELVIDILNRKPDFYRHLASLAVRLNKQNESLGWVEQAKSRAFLQLLGNMKYSANMGRDSVVLNQLDGIDNRITILRNAIDERTPIESPDTINNWRQALKGAIDERESLRRQLKVKNAEAASMVFVQPLSWDEMRDILVYE